MSNTVNVIDKTMNKEKKVLEAYPVKDYDMEDYVYGQYGSQYGHVFRALDFSYIINQRPTRAYQKYVPNEGKEFYKAECIEWQKIMQPANDKFYGLANLCAERFGLIAPRKSFATSDQILRRYLWSELKHKDYEDSKISISIFVEKTSEGKNRFRFCLELQGTDTEDMEKYHKHLEKTVDENDGFLYVVGSNDKVDGKPENDLKDYSVSDLENAKKAAQNDPEKPKKIQLSRVFEPNTERFEDSELEKYALEAVEKLMPYYEHLVNEFDKNNILFGPPGTGKTYSVAKHAVAICDCMFMSRVEEMEYAKVMERFETLKNEGRISFVTFHQSYGYEEFIEGIKPDVKNEGGEVRYIREDGIFKRFCDEARGKQDAYVFVIDEINRGNISKIFGELITLIEESKREGMMEAASVILPDSKKSFSVPNNVYILGTMNTADRSIALMDTALRRRFQFIEMMPNAEVLTNLGVGKIIKGTGENQKELDIVEMFETINKRIEILYDRDHTIGHAYFTKLVGKNMTVNHLKKIFVKSIIPLLQEYFYEDYEKIQLILGDNNKSDEKYKFIVSKPMDLKLFGGNVDMSNFSEIRYELNKDAFDRIESYIEIYSTIPKVKRAGRPKKSAELTEV